MDEREPARKEVEHRLSEALGASSEDSESLTSAVLEALRQATSVRDLAERVARRTSMPPVRALELCQMTCRFFAEELGEAALAHLQSWLPGDVLALFDRPASLAEEAPPRHHPVRRGQTLATGRPGSVHPLSESAPGHRESIALSPDPHADTKLSSSPGASAERTHDTLATGRPGSRRPLSESED